MPRAGWKKHGSCPHRNRGLIDAELDGILGSNQKSNDSRWNLTVDTLLDGLTNGPVTT